MPDSSNHVLAFAVTSLLIELTPGPNMAYLAGLSAVRGRLAGLSATAGIALGLLLIGIAAALGLAEIITRSSLAYEALRWIGVAYLLWLAWDSWRDASETSPAKAVAAPEAGGFFVRGLLTNLLNPKAAVFYVMVLPNFLQGASSVARQAVLLSLIYVGVATLIHAVIVLLGGTAKPMLDGSQDRTRLLRRGFSVAIAITAVWFAYTTAS